MKHYIPWRLLRLVGAGLLFCILVAAGKLWIDGIKADKAVQAEIARLDAIDPGWRYEDIQKQWKPIPPNENGALLVLEIGKQIPKDWPLWNQYEKETYDEDGERIVTEREQIRQELDDLAIRESLSPQARKLLDAELLRAANALAKSQDLMNFSEGSISLTYKVIWPLTTDGGLLEKIRNIRLLLQVQSLQQAEQGHTDVSCQAAVRLVFLGKLIGGQNITHYQSLRGGIVRNAVEIAERALAQGQADNTTLIQLQSLFTKEDQALPELILKSYRLERALTHRMFAALCEGKNSLKDLGTRLFPDPYIPDSWWDRFAMYFGHAPLRNQHAAFLRESTNKIEEWRKPWDPVKSPRLSSFGRICPEVGDKWYANFVVGDYFNVVQPRDQAILRCASLALAAERYRLEKGTWPKSLDALVPGYIKEVPADPFGKGPLRMVRKEDSIIIYSAWTDGVDNGGNMNRSVPINASADYGFQLWDVAQRNPIENPARPQLPPMPKGFDTERQNIARGKVETVEYESATTGGKRQMVVYTPPGYSKDKTYPVLYLLHGAKYNETSWTKDGGAHTILDNLHADKKIVPMVVVMPNGHVPASAGKGAVTGFESELLKDVMPAAESRYAIGKDPGQRALAGFSMGGGQSLPIGLKHLDTFDWLAGFSPALQGKTNLVPGPDDAKNIKLFYLACGDADPFFGSLANYHTSLEKSKVPHVWNVFPGGQHNFTVWKNDLYQFAQMVFKDMGDTR